MTLPQRHNFPLGSVGKVVHHFFSALQSCAQRQWKRRALPACVLSLCVDRCKAKLCRYTKAGWAEFSFPSCIISMIFLPDLPSSYDKNFSSVLCWCCVFCWWLLLACNSLCMASSFSSMSKLEICRAPSKFNSIYSGLLNILFLFLSLHSIFKYPFFNRPPVLVQEVTNNININHVNKASLL